MLAPLKTAEPIDEHMQKALQSDERPWHLRALVAPAMAALEADVLSNSIIFVRFCIRTRRDSPFVPAKAGTQRPQTGTLDSRLRGNERRRDPVRIRTSGTNTKANGALQ